MSRSPDAIAAELAEALADGIAARTRSVIALAGPPGVGKSTIAGALQARLQDRGHATALVPMDGYHLDNAILRARGLLEWKGAPETFDAAGFASLVGRLKAEDEVFYPVFDRARDLAVAGAGRVGADDKVILVEGNYLLLDEPGWRALADHWDVSIMLNAPFATLEDRLVQRWRDHGLDAAAARTRAEMNDLPNARRILGARLPADIEIGATDTVQAGLR
ncbi:MAG: nucleoside/nucleotide kinase family protein [Pseudomonadota bacterium]